MAMLGHFAQIVKPRHDWTTIFTLLTLYLLTIGPVALVAAKLRADYRMIAMLYLLTVAAVSGSIWYLGKRGYGESTQLNAIGYAAALGDGEFAVTSWNNLFVTSSGDYSVTGAAGLNAFDCPSGESLSGDLVRCDGGGLLKASIPMYSSRSFVSGSHLTVRDLDPQVVASAYDRKGIHTLAVRFAGDAAASAAWASRAIDVRAYYAGCLYRLTRGSDSTFALSADEVLDQGKLQAQFAEALQHLHEQQMFRSDNDLPDTHKAFAEAITSSFLPLIAYGLGGQGLGSGWLEFPAVPGRVALFLLVEHPTGLDVSSHAAMNGGMVFRFDLPMTTKDSP